MFTIIKNGEVFSPKNIGQQSILIQGKKIIKIGDIDIELLKQLDPNLNIIDAEGHLVIPGIIDPHIHLLGGGGEAGYITRTPEVNLSELIKSGITSVVGLIGTDGLSRTLTNLYSKAKALEAEGISTYMYTGNYHLPVTTITGSIKGDLLLIDKVIGTGEIAINDFRSSIPNTEELAKVIAETTVGGMLGAKAGVTHFHIGTGKHKLKQIHDLLENYDVKPNKIYVTHFDKGFDLLDEGIKLSKKGVYVDLTADVNTVECVEYYQSHNGDIGRLTVSSDGHGSLPKFGKKNKLVGYDVAKCSTLTNQLFNLLAQYKNWEDIIPLFTSNVAKVLTLHHKGRIVENYDADILVIDTNKYEIKDVMAKGKIMLADYKVIRKGMFE
ncbi:MULTISPECIES: beta-aspartyl-peptidase [Mammaliicoccus]|uniref:Isoaspartyl dipeptidase n=1 Tax=Mammaliicoccus vitulinus TaxID=71237 RepID=A0A2T4PQV4_9STAP|nr:MULTISPECIES: beta-aspartyl-peptidase [Mammaliicoccus]PTI28282.1 beta-aspartyl-peptidase [Mammaliicoccus vitulinus]PTI71809.1 beta-aspartyl-peptidase [Mammaliicoccus vitulinus]PTI85873.1 beta-aspartyl-peptidase [Mammaliicoccus vitulinus]QQT14709.1 beta-aspartyl-peptidase [Mammaliicoccus vitulinus]QQY19992.1 beta-aspartyl-peptidase [Mammaliicoccus vitulinus]